MDGSLESLEPVNKETTAATIADQLRGRIMDGTFPPGSQLGEAQLASRLDVSRGPVREALQRLVQEGLLVYRRNRGVFVITLDDEQVADVYLARGAVEREAVRILIRTAGTEALDELETHVENMSRAAENGEWPRVADHDLKFHELIVHASGSSRLRRMFGTLLVEARMCLSALEAAYPIHQRLVREHREILHAMRQGNEPRTLQLLDAHLHDAVKDLTAPGSRPPEA